jgi:DNA-binding transcriptional MerR regulator
VTGPGGSAAASPAWAASDPGWPAAAGGPLMSIGEVLAHLRPEFPDTTISKLRFLETEGLVEPRRTPSGYRKYTAADLTRLRYILTAQRDHYLPLRVIREQLAALDRGEAPPGPRPALVAVPAAGDPAGDRTRTPDVAVWLTGAELQARAGIDEALLRDLERHGLVAAAPDGAYPVEAVEVAAAAAQLAEFGLQPRHLRAYRATADREVDLLTQLVAPLTRHNDPAGLARAAATIRQLGSLTQRLHAALVRAGLRETLGR